MSLNSVGFFFPVNLSYINLILKSGRRQKKILPPQHLLPSFLFTVSGYLTLFNFLVLTCLINIRRTQGWLVLESEESQF